jgi:predicted nucleotidyltransferase
MLTKERILLTLKELKPYLQRRYKVKELGLFGSFVRGAHRQTSAIDVLVDFQDNADLFDFVGLSQFLESKLHRKVDVVPRRALRDEVLAEVISV